MAKFNQIISLTILITACNTQISSTSLDAATAAGLTAEYQRCSAITPSRTGLSLRKLAGKESQRDCLRALNIEFEKLVESAAKAKQAKIVSDIEAMQALKDNKRTVEYAAALVSFLDLQLAVPAPAKIVEPAATVAPEASTSATTAASETTPAASATAENTTNNTTAAQ